MKTINLLLILSVLCISCNSTDRKVENIRTFTKVYGYVRWFYPGDEASSIDWNRFAVYGIQKVENARNQKELKTILQELFKPIAPALIIDDATLVNNFDIKNITPRDTSVNKLVYWLHYGVYLGDKSNIYKSIRINKDTTLRNHICLLNGMSDISKYWGKEMKIVATMKSCANTEGKIFLVANSLKYIYLDYIDILCRKWNIFNIKDEWGKYEMAFRVNQNDTYLAFGLGIDKTTGVYLSDITLMVKEDNFWKPVKTFNLDMDEMDWTTNGFSFDCTSNDKQQITNKHVIKIVPKAPTNTICIGSYIRKNIGNNLICEMPLALYSDERHTFPVSDTLSLISLKEQLSQISDTTLNTTIMAVRLANVIIAWNVFQHFYPYFNVIHIDWDKELSLALSNAYNCIKNIDDYKNLSQMVAKLEDGHGWVNNEKIVHWAPPFSVALIENKIVVKASGTKLFLKGDIIETIDGRNAKKELLEQERYISGSPQLKRYRALNMFGSDFAQSKATIILTRNNEEHKIEVIRSLKCYLFFNNLGYGEYKGIDFGDGIYYENSLNNNFNIEIENMAKAKGVIVSSLFDHVSELIPHIIHEPVWSSIWNYPITTYPDRENTFYHTRKWKIMPQLPFINAKFIFIKEPFNVSFGETLIDIIDHYKLGNSIGDTTAGTNGNVNIIPLMGGYSISWTGMQVLKQDGSQLHLIGFRPDYPVNRTIKAIKEDRDEYIEKAKEVLLKQIKNH